MDREFRKWMKWYGKKHAEYTVSEIQLQNSVIRADVQNVQSPLASQQPSSSGVLAASWLVSSSQGGVLQESSHGLFGCCYWEHFQVFSEALGRFILLKRHFIWGCHVSSVCIKSPFTFFFLSPFSAWCGDPAG